MKLRLSIFKREELGGWSRRNYIRFVVVDLDRSEDYPANFVCILPKNIRLNSMYHTQFERNFGDNSLEFARKLLTRSLRVERDKEVKEEIRERLDLLKPK